MTEKVFINRKVQKQPFEMAAVEIIVPFHGQQAKVAKLMEGIFLTILTNRYQITLVDDGSPYRKDEDFLKDIDKAKIPGVHTLRLDKHSGFGAAVNHALANPKHDWIPWVCIMHSDVVPEDNKWLSELGACLQRLKGGGVKMVSPRTNNPVIDAPKMKAQSGDPDVEDFLVHDFLPMYCVLAHRELFERVGPLKENPYAGGEAEEYARRMRKFGFRQAVCGSSWVYHEGRGTLAEFDNDPKARKILRNAKVTAQ